MAKPEIRTFADLKGKDPLREEYWMTLEVAFTNRAAQPVEIPRYYVYTGSTAPIHQRDLPTYTGFGYLKETSMKLIPVSWFKGSGFLFMKSKPRATYPEQPETLSDVKWAGVTNQYFATLGTPVVDEKAMSDEQVKQRGIAVWAREFAVSDEAWLATGHPAEDHGEPDDHHHEKPANREAYAVPRMVTDDHREEEVHLRRLSG